MINSRRQRKLASGAVAAPRRLPPTKARAAKAPGSAQPENVSGQPRGSSPGHREPQLAVSGLVGRQLAGTREFRASHELRTDSLAYKRQNAEDHRGRAAKQRGFLAAPRPAAAGTNAVQESPGRKYTPMTGFVPAEKAEKAGSAVKALNFASIGGAQPKVARDNSAQQTEPTPGGKKWRKNTHGKLISTPIRAKYEPVEAHSSARVAGGAGAELSGLSPSDRVAAAEDSALMAASRHLQDIQHRIERFAHRRFGDVHTFKRHLPSDEGGNIDLPAFLQGARQLGLPVSQDEAALLFSALDRNADGLLGAEHIARVVKPVENTGLPLGSVQDAALSSSKGRRHVAPQHTQMLQSATHVYEDKHAGDEAADDATRDFLAFTAAQVPRVKALSQALYSPRGTRRAGAAVVALGMDVAADTPSVSSAQAGDADFARSQRASQLREACVATLGALGAQQLPDGRVRFHEPLRDVHAAEAVETPRKGVTPLHPSADGVVRLSHPVTRERAGDLAAEAAIVQQELRERVSTKKPKKFVDMLKRFDPYSRGYFTQDQFLALVAHDSGLNMRLDPRRARVLLHAMAAPATGMIPQHSVMAFLRNDKSQFAPSVAEHMAVMGEQARSTLEKQVQSKQEHIREQLRELEQQRRLARASRAQGGGGLASGANRSGGRFKPGTRSGEDWDEAAWAAAPSAVAALARSENPLTAGRFAAGGFGASGKPLLHGQLQAAARGFTDAVTAGRAFPDGDDAGDLSAQQGSTSLQDMAAEGRWPGTQRSGDAAGDAEVVVVMPSRSAHRKGAAAAVDVPRSTGNIGQSGGPVDGPIAGAHLLGMRGSDGADRLQQHMAQSLSASHMMAASRGSTWNGGMVASASSAQLHSTHGSASGGGGFRAGGGWCLVRAQQRGTPGVGGRGGGGVSDHGGGVAWAPRPPLPPCPHFPTTWARFRRGHVARVYRLPSEGRRAAPRQGGRGGAPRGAALALPLLQRPMSHCEAEVTVCRLHESSCFTRMWMLQRLPGCTPGAGQGGALGGRPDRTRDSSTHRPCMRL